MNTATQTHSEARVIPMPASHTAQPLAPVAPTPRAPMWRLWLGDAIDRAVPMPFLVFFFPHWLVVVVAYHLLCDCGPARRSFGQWVCRLRVVHPPTVAPCPLWRAVLQRLGIAFTQAAWCLWWGVGWLLLYELASFACILLSPTGRRPEEYLVGTQIVTEKVYRRRSK